MTKRRIQVSSPLLFGRWRDYWLDLETGKLQRQSVLDRQLQPADGYEKALATQGSLRRFGIGGAAVLFRDDGKHYLQIGRRRWQLGDPKLRLVHHHLGPLGVFVIEAGNFRRTFVEWRPGTAISRVVDPTYDHLDSVADDFACEVIGLHKAAVS